MVDPVKNFADADLSLGYDDIVTSVVLSTGHGLKLPDPVANGAYNVVWWNFTDFKDPGKDPNVEIVRITGPAGTGDTKTIVRAQEGTTAKTHNAVGKTYRFGLFMTKKMVDDIISTITTHAIEKLGVHSFDSVGLLTNMPTMGTRSFIRASSVTGQGCSISTDNNGAMYFGINCYTDGTNWNRNDISKSAYRFTIIYNGLPYIERVNAGANPIGSWTSQGTIETQNNKNVASGYVGLDTEARISSVVIPAVNILSLYHTNIFSQSLGGDGAISSSGGNITLSANANSYAGFRETDQAVLSLIPRILTFKIKALTFTGNSAFTSMEVGLTNTANYNSPNFIGIRVKSGTQWTFITNNSGVPTEINIATPVPDDIFTLYITSARVVLFRNGVYVDTITTNIPTAVLSRHAGMTNDVGQGTGNTITLSFMG